jgi:hypothetical protein
MELRYIPALDLRIDELQRTSVEEYLVNLSGRYPNLRVFESLGSSEKNKYRLLNKWYWGKIKEGIIDPSKDDGYWTAVEILKPPDWGKRYEKTPLSEWLGFQDRCGQSWDKITERLKQRGPEIIREIGLDPGKFQLDLLDILTWNLLANREDWGRYDIGEWCNTECQRVCSAFITTGSHCGCCPAAVGVGYRLIAGRISRGGAASVFNEDPWSSSVNIGFRLIIVFKEGK